MAGEVNLPETLPQTALGPRRLQRMERAARMLLLAAHEAWSQSGWAPSENLPVVLGTTSAGMSLGEDFYRQAIQSPDSQWRQATRILHYQAQRQALDLADAFEFAGPITLIANACASGTNAIGHAWELVRRGRAQRVLAGGYDALSQLVFSGFDSLQILSATLCRPFDAHRDGLTLGEGAAVLTLESLEYATRRDAEILGEILGYAAVTDGHHLTQPRPDGQAALASMTAACRQARLGPEQIDYLNAHGTGTRLNDQSEALAINRWAGQRARSLPVSSVKSGIGHLLGGAGAAEAVACLMALREGWLPPTANLCTPEPACAFELVREPREALSQCALSNSFGFGGANATLILRRWS